MMADGYKVTVTVDNPHDVHLNEVTRYFQGLVGVHGDPPNAINVTTVVVEAKCDCEVPCSPLSAIHCE